jgi:tRNA (guanine26-N2/guanine27-N2)-dimethyltransferase
MTTSQNDKDKFKSITEGSITMNYPADEETAVFYNPVQVQNRDLSILMLTLYSERRAVRKAVAEEKAKLRSQNQGKQGSDRLSGADIQERLDTYRDSLNPSQVVQAMDAKQGGMSILDALAASGLRSMRYWKEIPGVKHVTINDLEEAAVERAKTNLQGNGLLDRLIPTDQELVVPSSRDGNGNDKIPEAAQRPCGISVHHGDAKIEMYLSQRPQSLKMHNPAIQQQLKPQWDVIDLDPYGSAAPFLDAAVQAVESGGMLCVTCTDMAALGGSHPETCYGRYASMPIPNARYLQEVALRILLCSVATTAAKYGRTIRPILSVGMNFYIRCFVEVYDDKAGVR